MRICWIKLLITIFYGLACILIGYSFNGSHGVTVQVKDHIPTIQEIQTLVGAEPDGKLGPDTMAKWEKAVCNEQARRWFVREK